LYSVSWPNEETLASCETPVVPLVLLDVDVDVPVVGVPVVLLVAVEVVVEPVVPVVVVDALVPVLPEVVAPVLPLVPVDATPLEPLPFPASCVRGSLHSPASVQPASATSAIQAKRMRTLLRPIGGCAQDHGNDAVPVTVNTSRG
jgi:hypothetical protein